MNETNTDQKQKPKTSKLAIASIVCLGASFILCCSMRNAVVFFAIPVLGIAALFHIWLSKGRLRGKGLAITSIVIPIFPLLFLPGLNHLKRHIQRSVCVSQLREMGVAIKLYANDHEDQLPIAESWCDLLVIKYDVDPRDFTGQRELCDAIWGESAYALNKSVVGIKLSEIPDDVVMLFETTYGRTESERDTPREARDYFWNINDPNYKLSNLERKDLIYKERWNQVGGKEILTTEYHAGNGCHILFADGKVKFRKTEYLDTLRWEP